MVDIYFFMKSLCKNYLIFLVVVFAGSIQACTSCSGDTMAFDQSAPIEDDAVFQQSEQEIMSIVSKVDGFGVVELPASGTHILDLQESLTIDDLRGVVIDEDPPARLFDPIYNVVYNNGPERTGDGVPERLEPYRARQILPFRFHHFTNEFSFTGYFNWEITDYALEHGFNAANFADVPDMRVTSDIPVANSKRIRWSGFNWDQWRVSHGIDEPRLDLMPSRAELLQDLLNNDIFSAVSDEIGHDYYMVDLESPALPLTLDELREQSWYPSSAETPDLDFEERYYNGYVNTILASIDTAKAHGWLSIGTYGWVPVPPTQVWWDQEIKPESHWAWDRYGKSLYQTLDVIYFSTYLFYWDDKNVAYSLGATDYNLEMIAGESLHKPVRPYISNLYTGGGGGYRWWKWLPIRNEDMMARTAMNFFTGADGLVFWSDSMVEEDGILHNHHRVDLMEDKDYSVKDPFAFQPFFTPIGTTPLTSVKRYDALHVLDLDEVNQEVYFQIVQPALPRPYGIDLEWQANTTSVQPRNPIYKTGIPELKNHLRAKSEPIASIIYGMALARPFEYTLKNGEVKIDVPAKVQFRDILPIVRRVKFGDYHIVISYDPQWQKAFRTPRTVTLENFDGIDGLDLQIPADAKTRIFVLKTEEGGTTDVTTGNTTTGDMPAPATPNCGNGILQTGEECDGAGTYDSATETCTSTCQKETITKNLQPEEEEEYGPIDPVIDDPSEEYPAEDNRDEDDLSEDDFSEPGEDASQEEDSPSKETEPAQDKFEYQIHGGGCSLHR